jgi:hypothetical protein
MGQQSISIGRFNAILGRMLSMAGIQSPAADLSPEISPVLVLEIDRPEWKYLGNERFESGNIGVTSGAAAPGYTRLLNPTGSGVLAIIEKILVHTVTAAGAIYVVRMAFGQVARTNVGTAVNRDTRFRMGSAACTISQDGAAAVGTATESASILASEPRELSSCPIILGPGGSVDVGTDAFAKNIEVSYHWRERAIEPFEG